MISSMKIERYGSRSGPIRIKQKVHFAHPQSSFPLCPSCLTQIGEHISTVIIVPHAGLVERFELGGGKDGRSDRQSDRLVQALEAGETNPSFLCLIGMLIAISTTAFHTASECWIVTAMR